MGVILIGFGLFFAVTSGGIGAPFIFPLVGLGFAGFGVFMLIAGPAKAREFQRAQEAYRRRRAAVTPEQFLSSDEEPPAASRCRALHPSDRVLRFGMKPRTLLALGGLMLAGVLLAGQVRQLLADPTVWPPDDFVEYWAAGRAHPRRRRTRTTPDLLLPLNRPPAATRTKR